MICLATLNIYWFGFDPSREPATSSLRDAIRFQHGAAERERVIRLIGVLGADGIALQEIVDIPALEALLPRLPGRWTMRTSEGNAVASPVASELQKSNVLHVAWIWNADRLECLGQTRIETPTTTRRGQRPPLAARFRMHETGEDLVCVAVHAKSGDPRWTPDNEKEARSAMMRREELEAVRTWLDTPAPGFDVSLRIVVGDFNSLADSEEMSPLRTGSMTSWQLLSPVVRPPTAQTFSTKVDHCVIDHFVVSTDVAKRVVGPPEIYAFDADPLFLDDFSPSALVWKGITDHRPIRLLLAPPGLSKALGPARLTLRSREAMPKGEWSAVAPLGADWFLLADDEDGIHLWRPGLAAVLLRSANDDARLTDIESICLSEDGTALYAVSEASGDVFAFELTLTPEVTLGPPRWQTSVARPGKVASHGWEGMSGLPARFSPTGKPMLILVHENEPKSVVLVDVATWTQFVPIVLTDDMSAALGDLSDVAVCPRTGHLFLLSDQTETLVEAALSPDGLALIPLSFHPQISVNGSKPEGIAFLSDNALVLVTDKSRELLRFFVEREG